MAGGKSWKKATASTYKTLTATCKTVHSAVLYNIVKPGDSIDFIYLGCVNENIQFNGTFMKALHTVVDIDMKAV